ncbi:DUF3347 domain-containing protein [Hydrotalea sp.]|uniref:DUF3347 domain-containing protein n=1 Tax=Hydrotalea sp. TaxID=2881279 RepID=UPI00261EC8F7|nr:DUF3347 domain-containing protein [Hydrotalea sp.]
MKLIIFGLALAAGTFTACNGNSITSVKQNDVAKDTNLTTQRVFVEATQTIQTFSVKEIIADYLQLKNALAKDNGKDASTAANAIVAALVKVDMKTLSGAQMKTFMDIADDLKENAEHIGANADKIAHQREHFILLSKDIADLVKTFGNGGQTLYKDFCPMANNGKGAIWISEIKEIKNPYLGKAMPTCGSVKETIQ